MRSREIGWGNEAVLLWELQKAAKRTQEVIFASSSGGTTITVTPTITTMSSSGTIAAGKRSITITTSSDFSGTVLGTAISTDYMLELKAPEGSTLAAVPIVITAGSCNVLTLE